VIIRLNICKVGVMGLEDSCCCLRTSLSNFSESCGDSKIGLKRVAVAIISGADSSDIIELHRSTAFTWDATNAFIVYGENKYLALYETCGKVNQLRNGRVITFSFTRCDGVVN